MGLKYTVVCDTLKSVGYDISDEPQKIFKVIKEAGYDGVDLPGNLWGMNARKLRKIVDSFGLKVPELLGAWAYFHAGEDRNLAGSDKKTRKRGIEYSKKSIDLAVEMGAKFFEICAAQPPVYEFPFPKLPIKTLRKNFVESVREICEYAAARKITILFEPLNGYEAYPGILTTIHEAINLVNELGLDDVGIQPDVFHMNISDASIPDSLRAAGKLVRHFHLNETNHYELGTGHADFTAIVRTLKEINFTGYVAIYMPLTSQEIFQATSHGYGQSGPVRKDKPVTKPDLKTCLEKPLKYMKGIESAVDIQRKIYEVGSPYCINTKRG